MTRKHIFIIGLGLLLSTFSLFSNATDLSKTNIKIETNLGDITIALDGDKAPRTVKNFLGYVEAKFYDGTIFHRVISSFMIQGGGYDKRYRKKRTNPPIQNEASNGLKNVRGSIAMARLPSAHSATAQFFINVKDNVNLDHKNTTQNGWGYAVFGNVTQGMDIVDKIRNVETGPAGRFTKDAPSDQVIIKSIRVIPDARFPVSTKIPSKNH
jgi:peptidyl-prolyl cis-trans isomerase B (cyclophilin B)